MSIGGLSVESDLGFAGCAHDRGVGSIALILPCSQRGHRKQPHREYYSHHLKPASQHASCPSCGYLDSEALGARSVPIQLGLVWEANDCGYLNYVLSLHGVAASCLAP